MTVAVRLVLARIRCLSSGRRSRARAAVVWMKLRNARLRPPTPGEVRGWGRGGVERVWAVSGREAAHTCRGRFASRMRRWGGGDGRMPGLPTPAEAGAYERASLLKQAGE